MEKEFVPYEQALELKKLLFNERSLATYFVFGDGKLRNGSYGQTQSELFINGIGKQIEDREIELKMYAYHAASAPTFSQVFRWFREKYNLFGCIDLQPAHWFVRIDDKIKNHYLLRFETYEEAELACLKKLIEIAKTK